MSTARADSNGVASLLDAFALSAGRDPAYPFRGPRMIGKPIAQGVYGWVGYGRDDDDRQVGYLQLTVFF